MNFSLSADLYPSLLWNPLYLMAISAKFSSNSGPLIPLIWSVLPGKYCYCFTILAFITVNVSLQPNTSLLLISTDFKYSLFKSSCSFHTYKILASLSVWASSGIGFCWSYETVSVLLTKLAEICCFPFYTFGKMNIICPSS